MIDQSKEVQYAVSVCNMLQSEFGNIRAGAVEQIVKAFIKERGEHKQNVENFDSLVASAVIAKTENLERDKKQIETLRKSLLEESRKIDEMRNELSKKTKIKDDVNAARKKTTDLEKEVKRLKRELKNAKDILSSDVGRVIVEATQKENEISQLLSAISQASSVLSKAHALHLSTRNK